jgi:tetratricopeptide (TPR) repeat protein
LAAAAGAFRLALQLAPEDAGALNLMGATLLQLGQYEEAADCLQRAARKLRDDPGVQGNLAQAYFELGEYEQARETFRKASRLEPRAVHLQLGVANSLAMQRKFNDAEVRLRRQASRFPNVALVWHNLGNVLRDLARPAEAIACYHKALALDPSLVDARNNLGGALLSLLRYEEAEHEYRACIAMAPDYTLARCNLASVLIDLGRFSEAEAECREAIRLAPDMSVAHSFLGAALGHQKRHREALACHRAALNIAPEDPKLIETYASALVESGAVAEGLRWFAKALALNPDSASAHQLLSSALLGHGCLADGWAEYRYRPAFLECREQHPDLPLSRALPSALGGKHLCLLHEQGLGDELFFLRFVPQLAAAGVRVTYRASKKIHSLLARAVCLDRVEDDSAPLPQADAVMLLGDLPYAQSHYPAGLLPYIAPPDGAHFWRDFPRKAAVFWPPPPAPLALRPLADCLETMRQRLAAAGSPPYIGLTWNAGTPPLAQRDNLTWVLHKEIGIVPFAEALREVRGTFIALQRHPGTGHIATFSKALGQPVHDFTDLNENLEGMLALLALIDEYIGVSNTNMHLRAAAGRTAHVLVPSPAEWRWMASGSASPWFPGFRIYRQAPQGDWRAALVQLKKYFMDIAR